MNQIELKYGCNPNQTPSRVFMGGGGELPLRVLNGRPGYINFLDALNAWQLVSELKAAVKMPAAASFKHVSPAGAAAGLPLSGTLKRIYFTDDIDLSPLACAYARARGADRMSSFGDFIALSDTCDAPTAELIRREVSDGVIAPGYETGALEILKSKRKGGYNIVEIDPGYTPEAIERKDVFGITFEQGRNTVEIAEGLLDNIVTRSQALPAGAKRDLVISLITLKYTQSNSVCYAKDGQVIGIGAGQQSRIHCTRLAGNKADMWRLRQHPKALELALKADIGRADRDNLIDVSLSGTDLLDQEEKSEWLGQLTDVALGSDAFFPFDDNIERAAQSGVKYIAQPGGSIRDPQVIEACDRHGIVMAFTGVRLFHH